MGDSLEELSIQLVRVILPIIIDLDAVSNALILAIHTRPN